MNITKQLNDSELLLTIEGSIDTLTAPELDKELSNSLEGITSLILDFTDVDYVSSAGLRVLLGVYKTMTTQGKFVIRHVNPDVMEVFKMTGFDKFLTFED